MIFWDMDGVLADFNGGAKQLIAEAGLPLPAADDWHYLSNPLYKKQVQHIATSQCFWRNLSVIPEGLEAFNSVREHSMILSSPGFPVSATPKLDWCQKHLCIKASKVILASEKYHLAGGGNWLVDDHAGNCQKFCEAGGYALLVELPYSYKDGAVSKYDLHTNVAVCSVKDMPYSVRYIREIYYAT